MKRIIVLISSLVFALCLGGCNKGAASVAIIGGADGPTAISVTSNASWLSVCGFAVLVAVVLVAIVIYRNKKK